jgi:predicted DNA binding protein
MAAIHEPRPKRRGYGGRGPVSPLPARSVRVVHAAGRLVTCRLNVTLPPDCWLRVLTTPHPEYRVEVLSRSSPRPGRTITGIRLHGPREADWAADLERLPGVERVEILEEEVESALLQVTHITPAWASVAERHGVLWRLPFWVGEGEARWSVVAPEVKVRAYLGSIRPTVPNVRVEAVFRGTRDRSADRLTPRQSELVRRAVGAGYFEVPRRITLTGLAERFQLAKSTLSERLAVIERTLVAEAAEALACSGAPLAEMEPPRDVAPTPSPTPGIEPWTPRVPSVAPVLLTAPTAA